MILTATEQFILDNADADVRQLALKASRCPDVDIPFALTQIEGRQRARVKLPSWAAIDGVRYPTHISMEQCSSQQTALYKSSIASRLVDDASSIGRLVDITGGFGVDFSYIARHFSQAVYVERQQSLCDAARHNFKLFNLSQAEIICGDGVDYIEDMLPTDIIYIDPARRDVNGDKVVAISDCTPDILFLKDQLLEKSCYVLVKLSPMLDWHKAVDDLNHGCRCVKELHIVSVDNECKELLLVLTKNYTEDMRIYCVNNYDIFNYIPRQIPVSHSNVTDILPTSYLFEPNASIMKAGCFDEIEKDYQVNAIGNNSHLFISRQDNIAFPGRRFIIDKVSTMNRKELRCNLYGIDRANITTRNFPLSVAELRKRLKIKDGGEIYIFGTTVNEKEHTLLICHKAKDI